MKIENLLSAKLNSFTCTIVAVLMGVCWGPLVSHFALISSMFVYIAFYNEGALIMIVFCESIMHGLLGLCSSYDHDDDDHDDGYGHKMTYKPKKKKKKVKKVFVPIVIRKKKKKKSQLSIILL